MTRRRRWFVLAMVALALVLAILFGTLPRCHQARRTRDDTAARAIPHVAVVRPQSTTGDRELVLPGNVQPYATAPIFARATGYVRAWYADIGARVQKGKLLAELDIPEVAQQLQQARGSLAAARANLAVSQATASRFTALRNTRAASPQEVDTAVGALAANAATVAAGEANVRQLEQVLAFARIVAPFDGVITARNVNVGDLINAGSSTAPGTSLFQIAQSDKLRVFVSVPEPYATAMKVGLVAELTLASFPDHSIRGKLVRTASAIDPATRTLLVELEVPNPTLELLPGAFARVRFTLPAAHGTFTVPVEALLFRTGGLQLATVVDDRVTIVKIVAGRDWGDRIEVASGLDGDERVIVSPPDSIANGQRVRVTPASRPAVTTRP